MSLPPPSPPNWSTPPLGPFGGVHTFAELGPRKPRFKVGLGLVIVATVALIGLGSYALLAGITSLTRTAITTMPGTIDVSCNTGEQWRIGPQTSTTSSGGPVTITNDFDAQIDTIVVTGSDGSQLPVDSMGGSTTETFRLGSAGFTAVATFTCTSRETVRVAVTGSQGEQVAVFRSIGQTFRRLIAPLLAMLVALVVGIVGLVMAITGRRKPVR